jgi:hypothetical protein
MSAAETIHMAEASGIRLEVEGPDLILDADFEPPVDVVNAITRDKAEIIELLAPPGDRWTAEDWQVLFDERAGIAEFDGEQSRADAEVLAFECCVVEWLIRHPECSDPSRCAWCGAPDRDEHAVVPFWAESNGLTWLHRECWTLWYEDQWERARIPLAAMGLSISPGDVGTPISPDDFWQSGGE